MKRVLFVCMANVCRSTLLEAVLRKRAADRGIEIDVDSCGIGRVMVGREADPRSVAVGKSRGVVVEHSAQGFRIGFFQEFDYVFVVDRAILDELKEMAGKDSGKVYLASEFSQKFQGLEIGDPYYEEDLGFEKMMDMVEDCCEGILNYVDHTERNSKS